MFIIHFILNLLKHVKKCLKQQKMLHDFASKYDSESILVKNPLKSNQVITTEQSSRLCLLLQLILVLLLLVLLFKSLQTLSSFQFLNFLIVLFKNTNTASLTSSSRSNYCNDFNHFWDFPRPFMLCSRLCIFLLANRLNAGFSLAQMWSP